MLFSNHQSLNLKGIVLFESCKKRTPENKWAKTNSATDSDDEAGC
jgi:hypothetical protein